MRPLRSCIIGLIFFLTFVIQGCQSTLEDVTSTPVEVIQDDEVDDEEPLQVVIDTDMGKDDVLVLLYLFQHTDLDIKAITITGVGHVYCEVGLRNGLGLLSLVGREDIPIACGRERGLENNKSFSVSMKQGMEEFENLNLPDVEIDVELNAVELLSQVITDSPHKTSLLTLGPLTNVAELISSDIGISEKIGRVYIKGGVIDIPGNVPRNDAAELNIWADPHSADLVFKSGIPITLVPLNVAPQESDSELILIAFEEFEVNPEPTTSYDIFSSRIAAFLIEDEDSASVDAKQLSVITDGPESGRIIETEYGTMVNVLTSEQPYDFEGLVLDTLYGDSAIASSISLQVEHPYDGTNPKVSGNLSDEFGTEINDAHIDLQLTSLEGNALFSEHSISGTVPTWATFGRIGYRVNVECGCCEGRSNIRINEVRYTEDDSSINLIDNADFSRGLENWRAWGSALARIQVGESPEDQYLDVSASPDQVGYLNSPEFDVTPGATFTTTFNASVPSSSIPNTCLITIFLSPKDRGDRVEIPVEPVTSISDVSVSDEDGSFNVNLPNNHEGRFLLDATFHGADMLLPTYAELIIEQDSGGTQELVDQDEEHRIGVRVIDGVGEFYDKVTNQTFVPRGVNYVWFPGPNGQTTLDWFRDDVYDRELIARDFATLRERGFNTVRVWLDICSDPERSPEGCMGDPLLGGLNQETLDKVADVISVAKEEEIYLILASNDMPDNGGYWQISDQGISEYFDAYRNHHFLTEEGVYAASLYWDDLMTGLISRGVPLDAVLGWQLLNEQWMFKYFPPLSLNTGEVQTANGETYDLSDAQQKRNMVSDGVVYYIEQLRDVILEHDPTALVTMGFFAPQFPNPTSIGGEWYVDTAPLLESAALDFFDFHAFLGEDISFSEIVENFGMIGYEEKPIILGEFGAFHFLYPSIRTAGRDTEELIANACEHGFDGWLYWGYYSAPLYWGDSTWGFVDNDNHIMELISPINQPDTCGD